MAQKRKTEVRAGTPAVVALTKENVSHVLHTYEHDAASGLGYGLEAASALGVEPGRVLKTLLASVDGVLAVGVVPVTGQLDLKALAQALGGKKAVMADPAAAERSTGYVVGGISPLGQKQRLRTVIDASAEGFETVFVSGGRRGLDIELAPADLLRLTGAVAAPISRS